MLHIPRIVPQVGEPLIIEGADGLGQVSESVGVVEVELAGGVVGDDPGEDGVLFFLLGVCWVGNVLWVRTQIYRHAKTPNVTPNQTNPKQTCVRSL